MQVRTEIPAGVASGRQTLHAGDGFLIPPRTPHNATDLGPDTGVMLSTYIVESGEPIATFTHEGGSATRG